MAITTVEVLDSAMPLMVTRYWFTKEKIYQCAILSKNIKSIIYLQVNMASVMVVVDIAWLMKIEEL